jgi:hypothetical protein
MEGRLNAGHQQGSRDPLSRDVAQGHRQAVFIKPHEIVIVAAYETTGQADSSQLQGLHLRNGAWKQSGLYLPRDFQFRLEFLLLAHLANEMLDLLRHAVERCRKIAELMAAAGGNLAGEVARGHVQCALIQVVDRAGDRAGHGDAEK